MASKGFALLNCIVGVPKGLAGEGPAVGLAEGGADRVSRSTRVARSPRKLSSTLLLGCVYMYMYV